METIENTPTTKCRCGRETDLALVYWERGREISNEPVCYAHIPERFWF